MKMEMKETPGPGNYESHVISSFQKHKSPTVNFGTSKRQEFGKTKDVKPGPGNYNIE